MVGDSVNGQRTKKKTSRSYIDCLIALLRVANRQTSLTTNGMLS